MKYKDIEKREKQITRDPSNQYLLEQHSLGENLVFITYEGRIEGVIEEILKYQLKLKGRDELLAKHDIMFLYKPEAEEHINRIVETDEEVRDKKLEPLTKCRERTNIRPAVLLKCMAKKREIKLTFRNGQILTGRIHSFGIFSIRLSIGEASCIAMNPCIYGLKKRIANSCRCNVKTKVFHFSGCRYFEHEDCTLFFGGMEQAIEAGFRPHKQCVALMQKNIVFKEIDISRLQPGEKRKKPEPANGPVLLMVNQNNEEGEKVKGNLNVTIKINQLPTNTGLTSKGWVRFIVDAAGRDVQMTLRPKTWNKLAEASKNFQQWVAVITGDMGENIKNGFVLENPGIQVFEKKPKEAAKE